MTAASTGITFIFSLQVHCASISKSFYSSICVGDLKRTNSRGKIEWPIRHKRFLEGICHFAITSSWLVSCVCTVVYTVILSHIGSYDKEYAKIRVPKFTSILELPGFGNWIFIHSSFGTFLSVVRTLNMFLFYLGVYIKHIACYGSVCYDYFVSWSACLCFVPSGFGIVYFPIFCSYLFTHIKMYFSEYRSKTFIHFSLWLLLFCLIFKIHVLIIMSYWRIFLT